MLRHETNVRLQAMLDAACEAISLLGGKQRSDFDADRLLNLGIVRLFELSGEAANRVPDDDQMRYPEIQWWQIISLRNHLIHGYDDVDFDIWWQAPRKIYPNLSKL